MKFLHTADWHLNDRLGRIDRTSDLRTAVERIAKILVEESIDVLIVAGDLFSELARPDALRDTIRHWQEVFTPFLSRGGTILTITGNHDNENFCQTLRHAMTLAAPTSGRDGELLPQGRLYLAADPSYFRLQDRQGTEVQFLMMPYPTATRYLKGEFAQKYSSPEEKNKLLVHAFEQTLQNLQHEPAYRQDLPSVLVAHANVYGAVVGTNLFRLSESEDVVVQGERFADQFVYVALGHIHKPQALGHPHIRYSGSIEKMDLGEEHDQKSVVIFDVIDRKPVTEIRILDLPSTPIYNVTMHDPEVDCPELRREYPHAQNHLVNLHIHYQAGRDQLEEVLKEAEKIFPRWYARDWRETSELGQTLHSGQANVTKSFTETVQDYLTQELQNHTDQERKQLLELAHQIMEALDD